LTFFLVAFPILVYSETIDVLIKGVDDGVKTNKQQDYKEAVMNAKLEAIERAGVEITSITKIVNFKTKYDKVESKAKAALLPGFQIMDMGYQSDGTYTVVLSGKVQVGKGAKDRAKNRKQAIQKEIATIEARLATIEETIDEAERQYEYGLRRAEGKYDLSWDACGKGRLKGMEDCYYRAIQTIKADKRGLKRQHDRDLAGLPEESRHLRLKLSDLKLELAQYTSDTE